MEEVFAQLQEVFQDTFQDDEIALIRETSAADIEGWDSLMHVTLVLNAEAEFDVRFTSTEVALLKTVGELADLIWSKREQIHQ